MINMDVWNVDRIAAAELLGALDRAAPDERMSIAEQAFSKHRKDSHDWAARRVHRSAIEALDAGAAREFIHREAIWTDGYRFAEQCIHARTPMDLLGAVTRPVASRGQVLRALIRSAKQRVG